MGRLSATSSAPRRDHQVEARDEGGRLIVILDTGGVDGLAPMDERRRALLRALREVAEDIIVPAAVLAEGVFSGHVGRDHHVRQLLRDLAVAPTTETIGYIAGSMRQAAIRASARPTPSGVDAIVAAEADARAATDDVVIVTTDDDDLELLASLASNAVRVSILRP